MQINKCPHCNKIISVDRSCLGLSEKCTEALNKGDYREANTQALIESGVLKGTMPDYAYYAVNGDFNASLRESAKHVGKFHYDYGN